MQIAFKDWAIIVDALGRGQQIVVLRKGGLLEGPEGFQVEHPAFFLFPTRYHQQADLVLAPAQERYRVLAAGFPPEDTLRLEFHAEVVAWQRIESLEVAERLRGQHIWKDEVIAQRHAWGGDGIIAAMALRVHRLPAAVTLPMAAAYGGCKSWVELERDIPIRGSQPVLNQEEFSRKLERFQTALGLPVGMD